MLPYEPHQSKIIYMRAARAEVQLEVELVRRRVVEEVKARAWTSEIRLWLWLLMARVMPGLEEQPRDMSIIPKTSQNADECKMHFVANLFLFFLGGGTSLRFLLLF